MSSTDWATCPAIRDVVRELNISQAYVSQLIHGGRLHAKRTRLGWLVDPASVAAFAAERESRRASRKGRPRGPRLMPRLSPGEPLAPGEAEMLVHTRTRRLKMNYDRHHGADSVDSVPRGSK